MSPFWSSFFDQLKDCGRNATIFLATIGAVAAVFALSLMLAAKNFIPDTVTVLLWIALLIALQTWRTIRRSRSVRRERLRFPPLSGDELRVARSKLTRSQNGKT